jgi:peptidylprolyl isomerase
MDMKFRTILFITAATALILVSAGCNKNKGNTNKSAAAEIKKGVAPIADPEIAVIEMESAGAYGTIKLELYSNLAPQMVARFKELAKEGVYDGTTFHRINQSVIQGGDPLSKDADPTNDGSGSSTKPNVPAEFSDIPYDTGIVGAARGQDNNSANSQFFITLKREAGFDNRYTIFGKVIEGMNNVRTISGVQPKEGERPVEPVRIKSVKIQPRN